MFDRMPLQFLQQVIFLKAESIDFVKLNLPKLKIKHIFSLLFQILVW